MYPGTIFNWHDLSAIQTDADIASLDNIPMFMAVSSFDRGPEGLRVVYGQEFYDLYGSKMNFAKHGQPALQAANAINGGARLLVCRLVADDATLANVIMSATVTKTQTARKGTAEDTGVAVSAEDAEKILKGEEPSGATVDDPTTGFVVEPGSVTVKWTATSVTGCKTNDEVIEQALATKDIGEVSVADNEQQGKTATQTSVYPLIIASDNGRGVSNKSIKFTPDSTASKDMNNMFYTVQIYDGTTRLEKTTACLNPACVVNNVSYAITEDTSDQVQFTVDDMVYEEYINDLMGTLGVDEATIKKYDIIFCTDTKGSAVTNFNLDAESIDLNSAYGVNLQNGTNGEFGDAPFGTEAWTQAAVDVFEGVVDDSVWDVDQYKLCAVFDANYPDEVKDAIVQFVSFRQDCMFFRDLGTEVFSYASIAEKVNKYRAKIEDQEYAKFVADYYTTYQIYDPETRKRIRVTMMYDYANVMVSHFANGPYRPTAGIVNGMVLSNAIEGTINFTPRITPSVNQKALLDDLRVNYAIFQEGQCVVQSLYTSQDAYTQLSYICNVLGIQDVIRAVRICCPRQRYTFVTGNDFSNYSTAVNNVLKEYTNNFDVLTFDYTQDDLRAAQKIFYASIYFRFKNWAQTEQFDVYALPVTDDEEAS